MAPQVSIVVLNYNYPFVISRLLVSMPITTGVTYEMVVVDNGSKPDVVELLKSFKASGSIDTLVLEPANNWFSEGNNIGVRHCNPEAEYILLLNADTEIVHPLWLSKMLEWMNGRPRVLPYTWSDKHNIPPVAKRGIVSIGWSWDSQVPGCARPEGWCLMFRGGLYQEMSPDFPFHHGVEEMIAKVIRGGARCGMLCQYSKYIYHYEGGCETHLRKNEFVNKRTPNMRKWFKDLSPCDTLDFTLGEYEHRSYLEW